MDNNFLNRDIDKIRNQYHDFVLQHTKHKVKLDKQSLVLSIMRLLAFLIILISLYFAISKENTIFWIISISFIIVFIVLMKIHAKLSRKRSFVSNLILINKNELLSLDGDNSMFNDGKSFEIDYHDFSLDLDIFGKQSIYQKFNRTNSSHGSSILADWFNKPLLEKTKIEERQSASLELSKMLEYRQEFAANGMEVEENISDFEFLNEWQNQKNIFYNKPIYKTLITLIPIINISIILLYSFNYIDGKTLLLPLISTLIFVGFFQKKINKIHSRLSKRNKLLSKYVILFKQIEGVEFKSMLLNSIKDKLNISGKTASIAIHDLSKILSALDSRLNVIMGIILNTVFIWDIRQVYRMEKWKDKYVNDFELWFNSIGEFDALISLANQHYNNPEWTFPIISETNEWLIKEMRHPLMPYDKCIANNFEIHNLPFIKVVTGANMAGKSTYLRSVGSNIILGMIGAVVNAKEMEFKPLQMVSSLRTSDSLMSGESYFYAEIKRLQMIVNRLRKGDPIFVLLDEILKGTNSNDKEQGSRALLEQLIKLKTIGVIATHDLSLGNLSKLYPTSIQNQCFEVDIINDQLSFDYKIREGIAQNMNASFLLHKMGIV